MLMVATEAETKHRFDRRRSVYRGSIAGSFREQLGLSIGEKEACSWPGLSPQVQPETVEEGSRGNGPSPSNDYRRADSGSLSDQANGWDRADRDGTSEKTAGSASETTRPFPAGQMLDTSAGSATLHAMALHLHQTLAVPKAVEPDRTGRTEWFARQFVFYRDRFAPDTRRNCHASGTPADC